MKYTFPSYKTKAEFTPGTFSENEWNPGENSCVERVFYALPNDSEYAIFKFVTRTMTGRKSQRWEVWHNGKFSNNFFTGFDDAVQGIKDEISFWGFPGPLNSYRKYTLDF